MEYPEAVADKSAAGAPEKICVMSGVREYEAGDPVELWRYDRRLVIYVSSESGNRHTLLDLWDVINWLSAGNIRVLADYPNDANSSDRGLKSGN